MITTLTGSNGFILQSILQEMVASHTKTYGELAVERIDGEETDLARVEQALNALPLFSDRKLVVLRAPSKQKRFTENVEQILSLVPDSTDVIIVEPHLDKRLSYFKYLAAHTDYNDLKPLDANGLAKWLVDRTQVAGGRLGMDAAKLLVDRVGEDQLALSGELEKLLSYDSNISRESILQLTDASPQSSIFALLEAAFIGNADRMLILYEEQRQQNVEPIQIIAMLSWQLHLLALIKTAGQRPVAEVSRAAKVNEFSLRRSYTVAQRLSLTEIKGIIARLADVDVRLKRESLDADEVVQNLLVQIAFAAKD